MCVLTTIQQSLVVILQCINSFLAAVMLTVSLQLHFDARQWRAFHTTFPCIEASIEACASNIRRGQTWRSRFLEKKNLTLYPNKYDMSRFVTTKAFF